MSTLAPAAGSGLHTLDVALLVGYVLAIVGPGVEEGFRGRRRRPAQEAGIQGSDAGAEESE